MRPDSTSNRLVLPAPFGPMMPSTSPGSTESEMPCRIERPPRSSVMSLQAKSGADAIVSRRSPPRRLAHPVANLLELCGIADRFPCGLQVIGHVIAVAGVAKAHDAWETLLVFGTEFLALVVGIDSEHCAPDKAFRGGSGQFEEFGLRGSVLQVNERPLERI